MNSRYVLKILFSAILLNSCESYDLERTNPFDPFGLPDLVILNPNVTPAEIKRGNSISVSCQVKNQGYAIADFPIYQFSGLYYFLSADDQYDVSDVELGTSNINDLAEGKVQSIAGKSLTIPGITTPGNYYILFYVDKAGDIKESDENNNVSHFGITVID